MAKTDPQQHTTPHDTYLRQIFTCLPMAKDYFKHSLPEHILQA